MIKKCKVIINNEAVTVIRFGNIEVQIPSIHKKADYVNVLYENGKYKIVDEDYKDNLTNKNCNTKKDNKKTTAVNESK